MSNKALSCTGRRKLFAQNQPALRFLICFAVKVGIVDFRVGHLASITTTTRRNWPRHQDGPDRERINNHWATAERKDCHSVATQMELHHNPAQYSNLWPKDFPCSNHRRDEIKGILKLHVDFLPPGKLQISSRTEKDALEYTLGIPFLPKYYAIIYEAILSYPVGCSVIMASYQKLTLGLKRSKRKKRHWYKMYTASLEILDKSRGRHYQSNHNPEKEELAGTIVVGSNQQNPTWSCARVATKCFILDCCGMASVCCVDV